MRVTYDERAIARLVGESRPMVEEVGEAVAERAKVNARRRFRDRGGGGIESIRSRMVGDEARVGWDAEHFYMGLHEFGSSNEPPRPFLRPALYAVRKQMGGAKAGPIGRIRTSKRAAARVRRAREFHRSRRAGG